MKSLPITVLALLIALTALSGCQIQDTSWVYAYGGHNMPAGLYISILMDSYGEAMAKLQEAGTYELNMSVREACAQPLEGGTVAEWMITRARDKVREYYAVYDKMAEMGLAVAETEREAARASAINVMREQGDFYRDNGISENSLIMAVEHQLARSLLFNALYGEGGLYAVSEEEYVSFLDTQYAKSKMVIVNKPQPFDLTDEERENEEEALAAREVLAKEKAESYLARLEAGEKMEDIFVEYNTELAAIDAEVNNEDPIPVEYPGPDDLISIMGRSEGGYYGERVVEGMFAAEQGKPTLIDGEVAFFLVIRQDIADELPTYREELLPLLRSEAFNELIAEWGAAIEPSPNEAAIARYKPANIKDAA